MPLSACLASPLSVQLYLLKSPHVQIQSWRAPSICTQCCSSLPRRGGQQQCSTTPTPDATISGHRSAVRIPLEGTTAADRVSRAQQLEANGPAFRECRHSSARTSMEWVAALRLSSRRAWPRPRRLMHVSIVLAEDLNLHLKGWDAQARLCMGVAWGFLCLML